MSRSPDMTKHSRATATHPVLFPEPGMSALDIPRVGGLDA